MVCYLLFGRKKYLLTLNPFFAIISLINKFIKVNVKSLWELSMNTLTFANLLWYENHGYMVFVSYSSTPEEWDNSWKEWHVENGHNPKAHYKFVNRETWECI